MCVPYRFVFLLQNSFLRLVLLRAFSLRSGAGGSEGNAEVPGNGGGGVGGARGGQQQQKDGDVTVPCSWQDIKSVQNLIERCLNKFMTQTEIIAALQVRALFPTVLSSEVS